MGPQTPGTYLRRRLVALGCSVFAALALLYVLHIFYLQFLIIVWGAAVTVGFVIFEGKHGSSERRATPLSETEKWVKLQDELAAVEAKLSKAANGTDVHSLRLRKASLEQDLRKLKWSMRETDLENLRVASGKEPLKPIPPRLGGWQRRKREKREEEHLIDSLLEAEEVLATEPTGSAKTMIALIASDVRAHYRLLGGLEYESRNIRDYGTAWAALTAIAEGRSLESRLHIHTSRRVRSRLESLLDLATSKGLVVKGATEAREEIGESTTNPRPGKDRDL